MLDMEALRKAVDLEYAICVEQNIPTPASIAAFYTLEAETRKLQTENEKLRKVVNESLSILDGGYFTVDLGASMHTYFDALEDWIRYRDWDGLDGEDFVTETPEDRGGDK